MRLKRSIGEKRREAQMSEQNENVFVYLLSLSWVRKMLREKVLTPEQADRLNKKNAKDLNCRAMAL